MLRGCLTLCRSPLPWTDDAEGRIGLALLAGVLIGNTVEAYGAAHPIIASGHSRRFAAALLAGIGLVLDTATLLGGTVLSGRIPR